MQGDVPAAPHAHAQLQAVQATQPADAVLVHRPALATQQHPDAGESKAGTRACRRPNPYPERALVVSRGAAVLRRATEPRQMTGSHAAALCRPETVFRSASVRMCLSSDKSAKTLQSAVLVLKRPHLAELADAQVRVLLLPDVERRLAELRLLHGPLPSGRAVRSRYLALVSPAVVFGGDVTWQDGADESFNGKFRDECLILESSRN